MTSLTPHLQLAREASIADDRAEMVRAGDALLQRDPTNFEGLVTAGMAFFRDERYGLAAQLLGAAAKLRPEAAFLWNNLGCALETWHPKDALDCLKKAMQIDPDMFEPVQNSVAILSALGRWREAIEVANVVLADRPNDADVNHNSALALMHLGQWDEAWARWGKCVGGGRARRDRYASLPKWDAERIAGRRQLLPKEADQWEDVPARVVIFGEQGLGDEIFGASMFNDAIASGADVTIECEPRLAGLFRRSFPKARVIDTLLDPEPTLDVTHKLGGLDLGGLYAREPMRRPPYLQADPGLRAMFRAWLDNLGPGLKVGLAWTGGFKAWDREKRSIPVDVLGPIVKSPGCHFVSLEYLFDTPAPEGVHELPWATAKGVDYDLTAALIAELDLVVSVPQTCVDAAGALGTPCWALVGPVPPWRFAEAAGDEAWGYHGIEIYRRQGPFWSGVVAKVAQNLRIRAQVAGISRAAE